MDKLFWVGAGGFLGSVGRYLVSGYVQDLSRSVVFPFGTLAVNILGCFLIGFLSHLAETRGIFSVEARMMLITGMLGGFTTFSTFGNETFFLFRSGESLFGLLNLGIHITLGLFAVWLGQSLVYVIWR